MIVLFPAVTLRVSVFAERYRITPAADGGLLLLLAVNLFDFEHLSRSVRLPMLAAKASCMTTLGFFCQRRRRLEQVVSGLTAFERGRPQCGLR